eukprot:SAG31_NODE_44_length_31168_cov_16.507290_20_plen_259_part_00
MKPPWRPGISSRYSIPALPTSHPVGSCSVPAIQNLSVQQATIAVVQPADIPWASLEETETDFWKVAPPSGSAMTNLGRRAGNVTGGTASTSSNRVPFGAVNSHEPDNGSGGSQSSLTQLGPSAAPSAGCSRRRRRPWPSTTAVVGASAGKIALSWNWSGSVARKVTVCCAQAEQVYLCHEGGLCSDILAGRRRLYLQDGWGARHDSLGSVDGKPFHCRVSSWGKQCQWSAIATDTPSCVSRARQSEVIKFSSTWRMPY